MGNGTTGYTVRDMWGQENLWSSGDVGSMGTSVTQPISVWSETVLRLRNYGNGGFFVAFKDDDGNWYKPYLDANDAKYGV